LAALYAGLASLGGIDARDPLAGDRAALLELLRDFGLARGYRGVAFPAPRPRHFE
jgi:hypothetical protein